MKAVGYWIRSAFDNEFIHPCEVAGMMSEEDADFILPYLRSGVIAEQYRGFSWCRFHCGVEHHKMGSRDLTDGTWVWPEGLAHYVEVHRVGLPAEFLKHVRSSPLRVEPVVGGQKDFGLWISWCRTRRSPKYLALLAAAQKEAESSFETQHAAQISDLEARTGVSDSSCIWSGCANRALAGMKICADHSISDVSREQRRLQCSRIPDASGIL